MKNRYINLRKKLLNEDDNVQSSNIDEDGYNTSFDDFYSLFEKVSEGSKNIGVLKNLYTSRFDKNCRCHFNTIYKRYVPADIRSLYEQDNDIIVMGSAYTKDNFIKWKIDNEDTIIVYVLSGNTSYPIWLKFIEFLDIDKLETDSEIDYDAIDNLLDNETANSLLGDDAGSKVGKYLENFIENKSDTYMWVYNWYAWPFISNDYSAPSADGLWGGVIDTRNNNISSDARSMWQSDISWSDLVPIADVKALAFKKHNLSNRYYIFKYKMLKISEII